MAGSQCKWNKRGQNGAGASLKRRGGGSLRVRLHSVELLLADWGGGAVIGGGDGSAQGKGDELRGLQHEAPSLKARAARTAGTRVRGAAGGASRTGRESAAEALRRVAREFCCRSAGLTS